MKLKNKYGNKILAQCDCGCTYIEISKTDSEVDYDEYFVDFFRNGNGNYLPWKLKFRAIKDILLNRHVHIQTIILEKEDVLKFSEEIKELAGENNGES